MEKRNKRDSGKPSTTRSDQISDVHFIVEGEDFKCVGALLANSCAYFEKLLYGNFKEANSRDPIILKNVKKEGFLCVLRFCYGLDPKLTGKNVVATHRVSEMWGIDVLSRMCALFLVKGLHDPTKFFVLTSRKTLLLRTCWTCTVRSWTLP